MLRYKYKLYHKNGGKVPRSTRYYQRQRELKRKQEEAERQNKLHLPGSSTADTCDPIPSISDKTPRFCPTSDSDSDTLQSQTIIQSKKKKRADTNYDKPNTSSSSNSETESEESDARSIDSFHSVHSPPPSASVPDDTPVLVNEDSAPSHKEAYDRLCVCSSMTAGDVMFMVLNIGFKHGLTWQAQLDILKMFGLIYGKDKIPVSKYLLMKEIHCFDDSDIIYHIFCDGCETYLGVKDKLPQTFQCSAQDCDTSINVNNTKNFFLSLSIESQLMKYVKDENFVDNILNYRFQQKSRPSEYSDIYDGAAYKTLFEDGGILSSKFNFSYSFFTDGMAYGNTSTKTIWPIYLTINELPYEERSKYLILAGLYVGDKDPSLQILLKPFVDEATKLCSDGFLWEYKNECVRSYVVPLCCIADSVARPKILNMQSFSAEYGCTFCYCTSEKIRGGNRYPLNPNVTISLRTDESFKQDLQEVYQRRHMAQEKDRVFRGVKGASPLMHLDYFSVASNVVVDYMHNILLGCAKRHLEIILDPNYKRCWEGITDGIGMDHLIKTLDSRMESTQSSSAVYRELRSLKARKNWRASEYKSWILFYCIPCLDGFLKAKHLKHMSLMSKATYILLKKTVTHAEVEEAHKLFMLYSLKFQEYFGEENMVYNIHLLSHIAQGVVNFGPLWTHNSFLYEAQNRYIRKLSKNPKSVILEIGRKFLIYRSLPLLCSDMVSSSETIDFCQSLSGRTRLKKFLMFRNDCILQGTGNIYFFSDQEKHAISQQLQMEYMSCVSYQRMVLKRKVYCTTSYCERLKNNDSCAVLTDNRYVLIRSIFYMSSKYVLVVAEILKVSKKSCIKNEYTEITHIRRFERSADLVYVTPDQIRQPCIMICTPNDNFLSEVPYGCSVE